MAGRRRKAYRAAIVLSALAGAVVVAYWRCLRYPFIQDDWGWIGLFQNGDSAAVLKTIFTFKGVLFFRPLSELYLYVMYLVFGANPLPFHVAALLIHYVNACLVIAIVMIVTRNEIVSYATGFVYALACSVNFESLLWAVGIHDLGGAFFFFLALLLFLMKRPVLTALAYAAGCLCKETVIVLPAFFIVCTVALRSLGGPSTLRQAGKRLLPTLIALCAVIVVKIMGVHPQTLSPVHPYFFDFVGRHVFTNLYAYASWMAQAFDPYLGVHATTSKFVVKDVIVVLFLSILLVSFTYRNRTETCRAWFFFLWFAIPLMPIIFMPNHTYRYYAMYSLPAFIAAVLMQTSFLAASPGFRRRLDYGAVIAVALVAVILSSFQASRMLDLKSSSAPFDDGTNDLVRKAAVVESIREGLMMRLPSPPHGATIFLGGVNILTFGNDAGPRAWLGDMSISVYPRQNFAFDSIGVYVAIPTERQDRVRGGVGLARRYLDRSKIFAFQMSGSELRPVNLDALLKGANLKK